jgi:hypothetical protein
METASIGTVLAVVFSAAALLLSVVRPGKNVQTIRALGVVGMFGNFWIGLIAIVWALADVVPSKDLKAMVKSVSKPAPKKKK